MLVVEVAIVHEDSGGTRGESRQQVPRVYGSGVAWGVGLGSYCYYLLCLVRSIEPTKLLFNQIIVDHLIRLFTFNQALVEYPGDASLGKVLSPL